MYKLANANILLVYSYLVNEYLKFYQILIGWYPEGLRIGVYDGWIKPLFENGIVIAAGSFLLILYLAAILCYRYNINIFLYEKLIPKIFRLITFYIFFIIPLRNFCLLRIAREYLVVFLGIQNSAVADRIILLGCVPLFFFLKFFVGYFDKKFYNACNIGQRRMDEDYDSTINPESVMYFRSEDLQETIFDRAFFRILLSAFYLYRLNTILVMALYNPLLGLVFLICFITVKYLIMGNTSSNPYGNGIIYNYISIYLVPFLSCLVTLSSVLLFALATINLFLPISACKTGLSACVEGLSCPLFSQTSNFFFPLFMLTLFAAFIFYCIIDKNKDNYLDSTEAVKKNYRVFEVLVSYLKYAKKIRTTSLKFLRFPLSITEFCIRREYMKLANGCDIAVDKLYNEKEFTDLELETNCLLKYNLRTCIPESPASKIMFSTERQAKISVNLLNEAQDLLSNYCHEFNLDAESHLK